MKSELAQLLRGYSAISLIGMCKNAGKTTVLGDLLRGEAESTVIGVTSIGRDGENTDLVTGTAKPGVFVVRGTLVATAEQMLRRCDITREILCATGISTPLGEVVLVRALSDGFVEIAGPSVIGQLIEVSALFREFGAQKVFIDGAISRKTLCTRELADATVLCTGASCDRDMESVVAQTAHTCALLTLPETQNVQMRKLAESRGRMDFFVEETAVAVTEPGMLKELLRRRDLEKPAALYLSGALTDSVAGEIAGALRGGGGMEITVADAGRLLLSQKNYETLLRRGCALRVLQPVNLVAVTVNPFSAYGFHFDGRAFRERVARAVAVPVINVLEETHEFDA